jgi:hypothetical protein
MEYENSSRSESKDKMKIVNSVFVLLVLMCLPACFGSASAARRAQTLGSAGWSCYSDPIVSCPTRPNHVCTGWDQRWYARCPDTGVVYVCRFAEEGATYGSSRWGDDSVICHPEHSTSESSEH